MDTMGTLGSMGGGNMGTGLGLIGSGIKVGATIGGGMAAKTAADYEAAQYRQAAARDLAAGQRGSFDVADRTNQVLGTAQARGAASGVNIGASPTISSIMGDIAQRGRYLGDTQIYQGQVRSAQDIAAANAAVMRGKNAYNASILEGVGTGLTGAAKYGPKLFGSSTATGDDTILI